MSGCGNCSEKIAFVIVLVFSLAVSTSALRAQDSSGQDPWQGKIYQERLPQQGQTPIELTDEQRRALKQAEDKLRQRMQERQRAEKRLRQIRQENRIPGDDQQNQDSTSNQTDLNDARIDRTRRGDRQTQTGLDRFGGDNRRDALRELDEERESGSSSDVDVEAPVDRNLVTNNDFARQRLRRRDQRQDERRRSDPEVRDTDSERDIFAAFGEEGEEGDQRRDRDGLTTLTRTDTDQDNDQISDQDSDNLMGDLTRRQDGDQQNNLQAVQVPGAPPVTDGTVNNDLVTGALGRPNSRDDAFFFNGVNETPGQGLTAEEQQLFAPLGIRVGSFLAFPEITMGLLFNDNPLASPDNGPSDHAWQLLPRFSLRSDWSRHSFEVEGSATLSYYDELQSEDEREWNVLVRGRIDVTERTSLELQGRIANLTDDRDDLDTTSTDAELGTYEETELIATLNHRWNRLGLRLTAEYLQNDYNDTTTLAGLNVNNDDRDFEDLELTARVGYFFHPGFQTFVEGTYLKREHKQTIDDNGFRRDSDGYRISAGFGLDFTSKIYGEARFGYRNIEAKDARIRDAEDFIFDVNMTYRPSDLTTLTFNARTELEPTDLDNTIGQFTQSYALTLRHSLRRHLILTAGITYEIETYEGLDAEEKNWILTLGTEYIFNRHMRFYANYAFRDVDTNDVGGDYRENEVRMGLILRR